ncbi:putative ribonuclease H-like domain-containing protein [Tanacetum coccineum]
MAYPTSLLHQSTYEFSKMIFCGKNVNTARPKAVVNTVKPKAVLNAVKENQVNAVKASACWVWKPKTKVLDHGNPQMDLQDQGVIDSGCSRHMTGNMSYLTDFEEIDGGYVAFGGNPKGGKITGRATKDETSGILKSFINGVENLIDQMVKVIRCDNGTEFKNKEMNQFCERKGSGPNWLFDIDALTKSMNYKPVITGNQSNGNAGTKACDDAGKARMEIVPGKDYILLPLWHADPSFSQNSKSSPDAGFKPLGDNEKKVTKEPGKEGGDSSNDQEKEDDNVNSTNNVNTASDGNNTNNINVVSSTVNVAGIEVNVVGAKTSIELLDDPNMPELEDIIYSDDAKDVGAEADMNNLNTFMHVSPIPTTRIHKDHPVEQIIGYLNSAPQTRRMTKNLKEHGLFSYVHVHKDFQNCLFACFLSQEEPKKVIHALNDPSLIEAMQEELLQFKLQEAWTLDALTKWSKDPIEALNGFYRNIECVPVQDTKSTQYHILQCMKRILVLQQELFNSLGGRFISWQCKEVGLWYVDFLNASSIKYALTVNPSIYTSCIEQFWSTTKAKTVNGEVQLQAVVDGRKIVVTEASVRRDL